jgi:hypothetical protein
MGSAGETSERWRQGKRWWTCFRDSRDDPSEQTIETEIGNAAVMVGVVEMVGEDAIDVRATRRGSPGLRYDHNKELI